MLTDELKNLRKEAGPAASFLQSRIEEGLKIKGTKIQIEGAKAKDVKLLLHKFLHHRGLDGYRVLVQSGIRDSSSRGTQACWQNRRCWGDSALALFAL